MHAIRIINNFRVYFYKSVMITNVFFNNLSSLLMCLEQLLIQIQLFKNLLYPGYEVSFKKAGWKEGFIHMDREVMRDCWLRQ